MRVLIADDHPIVLEGLAGLLRGAGHAIVARCRDGEQVLAALADELPDIMVLDVRMPGIGGLDLLRRMRAERQAVRVVLLSSSLSDAQALEAIRLGVDGLVLKEAAGQELLDCLGAVAAGRQWIDPAAAQMALSAAAGRAGFTPDAIALTAREIEIVRQIARGRQNKEIARHLEITEGTVKMHLHHIYEKLSVKNRTELCVIARDNQWV